MPEAGFAAEGLGLAGLRTPVRGAGALSRADAPAALGAVARGPGAPGSTSFAPAGLTGAGPGATVRGPTVLGPTVLGPLRAVAP
ncbi:hypothetical protein [Pseudonocardia spinosispora]|uniref:hypothetical protein n=1 Tax=Pseudonocardia spinosispora TaxID=103441 RepID=UPI00040F35A9|nr:hypothetical protein [Pseudonocardia spinosispora]